MSRYWPEEAATRGGRRPGPPLARGREGHPTPAAIHQRHAQMGLQRPDLLADRGMSHTDLRPGPMSSATGW